MPEPGSGQILWIRKSGRASQLVVLSILSRWVWQTKIWEQLYIPADSPKAQLVPVLSLNNSITKNMPREMNAFSTKMHMWNFHNSFMHNSSNLKQPEYPWTREWINCGIYNTAIKRTSSQYLKRFGRNSQTSFWVKKKDTRWNVLYDFIYIKFLNQVNVIYGEKSE